MMFSYIEQKMRNVTKNIQKRLHQKRFCSSWGRVWLCDNIIFNSMGLWYSSDMRFTMVYLTIVLLMCH